MKANAAAQVKGNDPFGNEPKRHPAFRVQSEKPFNGETPLELLPEALYTPNELFFVRSHLPTPDIKPDEYELEVSGLGVNEEITLSLEDIKKLPKVRARQKWVFLSGSCTMYIVCT